MDARLILRPWLTEVRESFTRGGSRVANSPVFPGTSRISAHVSRVPAYAFPGRKMSRFSYARETRGVAAGFGITVCPRLGAIT